MDSGKDAQTSDKDTRLRIAIIVYEYGLGNSPSLINLARLLAGSGYGVDFFTCNTYLGDASFDDPHILIHSHKVKAMRQDILSRIVRAISWRVKRLLPVSVRTRREGRQIRCSISAYTMSVATIMDRVQYKCVIGVEPYGLMAASILGKEFSLPYIYYNMELHSRPDAKASHERVVKSIEVEFHKGALFTITQDDARAEVMVRENALGRDTMVTVPVCADGEPFWEKTNILRERLGIGAEKVIVLYAGFLAEWAMCEEMAIAARTWPDSFVLVLHSHGYDSPAYIARLKKHEGEKVFFSDAPVLYEELPGFLASADIGVALYRDMGKNFTLIGSASGKIAHYLKSGLPIVVNNYQGISNIVESFNCGIGIGDPVLLAGALQNICDNYAEMRQGAFHCYEERYRFSKYGQKILDRLEQQ